MAVGTRVTVTGAADLLVANDGVVALNVKIKNGAAAIDLGGASVTSGAGYEMAAAAVLDFVLGRGERLYAICATSSIVQVLTAAHSGD